MPFDADTPRDDARQPVFNAPWPALALTAIIVGGYLLQGFFPIEQVAQAGAFSAAALEEGRWFTLVSALFLHGSWAHALMNAGFALAFGTPVARSLGVHPRGVAVFALFYLVCGVLANLGYAAMHRGDPALLVGASGAVSGLLGAAARLIAGRGKPGPILSRPVFAFSAAIVAVNLLVAATGVAPGANGATVAWEAHLAGFAAGLLLYGPAMRLARGS
jgi:membrane associated rhomboid family serine protease